MKKNVIMIALILIVICEPVQRIYAANIGYNDISQTEDTDIIRDTEEIGAMYGICPELLQSIIFYESSNRKDAANGACYGLMQVNKAVHMDRANKLGTSISEPYDNILIGADILHELFEQYEDVGLVLMKYHGESDAVQKYEAGEVSEYAVKILELSEKLERRHGK